MENDWLVPYDMPHPSGIGWLYMSCHTPLRREHDWLSVVQYELPQTTKNGTGLISILIKYSLSDVALKSDKIDWALH